MIIGGFRKLSLVDFPNYISSVVFTRGCNFRCVYCHNPHLVYPELYEKGIQVEDVFIYLKKMASKIEAVVISGGEPTIQPDLPELCSAIKKCNLKLKLDTNGSNPEFLQSLIKAKLLDYIAMDIKADKNKYNLICGCHIDWEKIDCSIEIIKSSGLPHQFRTTYINNYHTFEEIKRIKNNLSGSEYVLQNYRPFPFHRGNNIKPISENEFEAMIKKLNK